MNTPKDGNGTNKPGEPAFQMKLEPEAKLFFKYRLNEPCTVDLKITNTTKDRQTYKVKCTDNDLFRVRPPLAFIKPDEVAVVKVVLSAKKTVENNRHFFAIYHMKCDDINKTARQVWVPNCRTEGVARIQAEFEEIEGTKKEEDKKEEKKEDKKEDKKDDKKDDKKEKEEKK